MSSKYLQATPLPTRSPRGPTILCPYGRREDPTTPIGFRTQHSAPKFTLGPTRDSRWCPVCRALLILSLQNSHCLCPSSRIYCAEVSLSRQDQSLVSPDQNRVEKECPERGAQGRGERESRSGQVESKVLGGEVRGLPRTGCLRQSTPSDTSDVSRPVTTPGARVEGLGPRMEHVPGSRACGGLSGRPTATGGVRAGSCATRTTSNKDSCGLSTPGVPDPLILCFTENVPEDVSSICMYRHGGISYFLQ